ncbi:MAG: hypothetical protein K2M31_07525 [Muribaculaceae bacterium]|nr:hypothetical protein [Muribaculaceae bacterium]
MKANIKYILAAVITTASSASALAQASYSGYYLDNYTHRYQLNPAMTDEGRKTFISMPVLGNLNIGMQGNLHVSSLLYPVDGKTVLFTHPDVPTSTVLKNIHDVNKLGANLEMDIIDVGFTALGGQNVVSISAVADGNIGVPGSLIRLMKEGPENKTYDISDFRVNASAYAKLQLNHSRKISQLPGLKVGAAVKFLFGLGNIDGYFNNADLTLGTDSWTARTQADLYANLCGAKFKYRYDDDGKKFVDGLDMDGVGLTGFGLGFDLGATYKWRDFEFNLALLDLGFISWSNTLYATTDGIHSINTSDYTFGVGSGEADATWDKMKSDLENLYQLESRDASGRTRSLRTTLNWGVRYTLPQYRRLNFGLINSTRFNGPFTTTDFRFSANVNPVDCLSASANLTAGTYGAGFGWLLNVNVKGFNLFVGMDRTFGKLAKQFAPLNSNGEFNFGMNFPF